MRTTIGLVSPHRMTAGGSLVPLFRAAQLSVVLLLGCDGVSAPPPGTPLLSSQPPVVLISVDTLRADHLPAYGYQGVDTPEIDRLRADSVLFENAYSHSPLTLPSHLSLLTGLLPYEHQVRNNIGYRFDGQQHLSLPALLAQNGYATGAAVSAYVLRGQTGVSAGFDFYEDAIAGRDQVALGALQRPGHESVRIALDWITENANRPLFFFLHVFEPHAPYEPIEPFRSRYPLAYDGEIATVDEALGPFLDGLRDLGIYDQAIIVFFSDHGEGLFDHGEGEHGIFLYREAIRVPLMVKLPSSNLAGASFADPVQLVDLFPTIGELTGLPVPGSLAGDSLVTLLEGGELGTRQIYSETLYPRIHLGWSELRSLIDERFHLIGAPRPELYDIQSDPGETENIAREEPSAYREMRRSLGDQGADLALPSTAPVEDLEKLAALGYLGSIKAPPDSGTLPDPKDRIDDINKLREAFALESRGRSAEAIDVLRRLVERNPGFMDAWNKLALTLDTAGRWTEAIETYQRALAHAPSLTTEYALSLSSIHLKLGQLEEAISHAELAADRHPAKAAILLGRIAFVQGQLPLAEQHARVAMGSSNERFTAAVLLIKVLTAQRRLEEAMALAVRVRDEAVAGAGGPIQGLAFVYGDLLARRGDNHQAEEAFREEIRLFPRDRQTYANLALLLTTQGRIDQARALLEELGERNPGLQTYLFAAQTFETLGDRQTAAQWRQRAEKLSDASSPRP